MIQDLRRYANFFEWPHKPTKEMGIVALLSQSMEKVGDRPFTAIRSNPSDPPDCIARNGSDQRVGIEVTELVSQEAVEENEKGRRVFECWTPSLIIDKIDSILERKDVDYKTRSLARTFLLIYTDEPTILFDSYAPLLRKKVFRELRYVDRVYFLFSYHEDLQYCPYLELKLDKGRL